MPQANVGCVLKRSMRVSSRACDESTSRLACGDFLKPCGLLDSARAAEAAKEPEHHKNEHDHAKNAAESSAAVAAVRVVPAATAE